ncbi:MAG: hypothetical protein H0U12_05080 [Thermoleophilaceae bacterium]|nr:hypothetical protein [Thermoleophilaceae bacterium]
MSPTEGSAPALVGRQRRARALVGAGLCAVALTALSSPRRLVAPVALAAGWLGASHLVAAATSYRGCPELGAIPSLVLGRRVETRCGPWARLDRRLRLDAGQS